MQAFGHRSGKLNRQLSFEFSDFGIGASTNGINRCNSGIDHEAAEFSHESGVHEGRLLSVA
jgi:hypothetical protein